MCLLAICEENKLSLEDFNDIYAQNQDGCGFAYVKDGKAVFKKGLMHVQESWDFHDTLELPFIIHFRKKSHGAVSKELCHPFIVSKESPLDLEGETDKNLLFMNGTSAFWEEFLNASGRYVSPGELFSDTRAIAMIIANDNERFLETMKHSKFVVIDPKVEKFIRYFGDFQSENGILYSNFTWRKKKQKTQKISTQTSVTTVNYTSCGTNISKDYERPWNDLDVSDSKHLVLRYLLNKITIKAGIKLWNRYKKRGILEDAHERAIKIMKQQNKDFTPEREKRIRHFINAQGLDWADKVEYLRNQGIKTHNLSEDPQPNSD